MRCPEDAWPYPGPGAHAGVDGARPTLSGLLKRRARCIVQGQNGPGAGGEDRQAGAAPFVSTARWRGLGNSTSPGDSRA